MLIKTWLTVYVADDEADVKIVQHRSKGCALAYVYEDARESYEYNPRAFYPEPEELYDDVWAVNETDYYQIKEVEIDTTKGFPA